MIDIRLSDNLKLMSEMQDNSVDLIYCDVLYGTGRNFKDYQDLKPKREIIEEHYIPRIKEMHRILKDTGSIYLQMDTRINHWMRCIMDDFFGYGNFLNDIIWCYSGGGVPKKDFAPKHDHILRYSKTENYIFNLDDVRDEYSDEVKNSNPNRYDKSYRKNGVYSGYKPNPLGKHPNDWWKIQQIMPSDKKERIDYATQKPKKLIERIIKASSNEGDLVADFYGGSFTTAEVCKDLNRNFIGCDISEKAVAIGLKRTNANLQI